MLMFQPRCGTFDIDGGVGQIQSQLELRQRKYGGFGLVAFVYKQFYGSVGADHPCRNGNWDDYDLIYGAIACDEEIQDLFDKLMPGLVHLPRNFLVVAAASGVHGHSLRG